MAEQVPGGLGSSIFDFTQRPLRLCIAAVGEGFCPACTQRLTPGDPQALIEDSDDEIAGTSAMGTCLRCALLYRAGVGEDGNWFAVSEGGDGQMRRTLTLARPD